jgi:hypothetical protein
MKEIVNSFSRILSDPKSWPNYGPPIVASSSTGSHGRESTRTNCRRNLGQANSGLTSMRLLARLRPSRIQQFQDYICSETPWSRRTTRPAGEHVVGAAEHRSAVARGLSSGLTINTQALSEVHPFSGDCRWHSMLLPRVGPPATATTSLSLQPDTHRQEIA